MGGPFSGRWQGYAKATAVEDCRTLDLGELAREGALKPWQTGAVRWFREDREVASVGFTVRPAGGGLVLVLSYRVGPSEGEGEDVEVPIPLETTRPHFGGVRWWGRCPLVVGDASCRRRVGKLYLPPGARYFGCRACYRLSYRSVQEHDKRVDQLRRNPELLAALAADPRSASVGQLMLIMKALRREMVRPP